MAPFVYNLIMITAAASLFLVLSLQDNTPTAKVTISSIKKDVVTGSVTVKLPEGWHAYQNPPKSEYENPLTFSTKTKGLKLTKISYPAGKAMKSSGNESLVYEGEVKVPFTGKIDKALKPAKGAYTFEFEVAYQICNDSTCLPPSTLTTKVTAKVSK